MAPGPINIQDFFLTDEVEKLKRERDNLKEEIKGFYKRNKEFSEYKTILNKLELQDNIARYNQEDIEKHMNYIRGSILLVLVVNILIAIYKN